VLDVLPVDQVGDHVNLVGGHLGTPDRDLPGACYFACHANLLRVGNDPESLSFACRRGFTEVRRQAGLVLSLAGVSPPRVQPPAGIEVVTWAQRPELARGMYEVNLEIHPAIPGFEDVAVEPFEAWMAHNMRRPADSPEVAFIALAGERSAAFSKQIIAGQKHVFVSEGRLATYVHNRARPRD
jgi:hypothetical protein